MAAWECPDCGRRFGRRGQGHESAPAMTVEEYFSTGPPHERPVYDAVIAGLDERGVEPFVEPVSVGIFLKRAQFFAELRPRTKWVAVGFVLHRKVQDGRLGRKVQSSGSRHWHVVNVRTPDEVDDQLLDWLVEAWDVAPQ